jgi:hypothetical protein
MGFAGAAISPLLSAEPQREGGLVFDEWREANARSKR